MSKVINMEGVRSGTAHLKRARELGKARVARLARPVPIEEIISGGNVFTVEEVSALVRLAPITIRRAIRSGALRAANGGGKSGYRITRGDVSAWWDSRGGGNLFEEVKPIGNPLARALAMVQARDATTPARPMRTAGVNDAASDIRAMREEQTP